MKRVKDSLLLILLSMTIATGRMYKDLREIEAEFLCNISLEEKAQLEGLLQRLK